MHGLLTWEHRSPSSFRAAAREDLLAHYGDTINFQDSKIVLIERNGDGKGKWEKAMFRAVDEEGNEFWGRKVLLATGVKDVMPQIPGYEEAWKGGGIFHCLFCHG